MTVKTMVAHKCTPLRNAARHRQGAAAVERRAAAVERRAAAVERRAAAAGKEGYHVIYIVHTCTHVHTRAPQFTCAIDGKDVAFGW